MSTAGSAGAPPRGAAVRLACLGCAHALLLLLAYTLLTSTPGGRASDEELVAFYQSGSQRRVVLVGLYLMPFAGIAFLWFSTALRVWIRVAELPHGELIAGVQHVSGILYVGLFFTAAAASSVTAVSMEFARAAPDPALARLFPLFGGTLLLFFAMRMAAMFMFTTSRLGRRTGVLPAWFSHLGLLGGLFLLLSASLSRVLVLVFPLWLLALCTLVLVRAWKAGTSGAALPDRRGS